MYVPDPNSAQTWSQKRWFSLKAPVTVSYQRNILPWVQYGQKRGQRVRLTASECRGHEHIDSPYTNEQQVYSTLRLPGEVGL